MKKILLLSILAFITAAAAKGAIKTGDYIYTLDGKYQVLDGTNLVKNGDFTSNTDNWTNHNGEDVTDVNIEDILDTDGSTTIKAVHGTAVFSISQSVSVEPNYTYLITYKVKAEESVSGTATKTQGNEADNQLTYFNNDGSRVEYSGGEPATGTENITWQYDYNGTLAQKTFTYTPTEDGFIVFDFLRIPSTTYLADFGIYKVNEVGDERKVQALVDTINILLEEFPDAPSFRSELEEAIETLTTFLEDPANNLPDPITVEEYIKAMREQVVQPFLDANTVDIGTRYMTNINFSSATTGWTITTETRYKVSDSKLKIGYYGSPGNSIDGGEIYQSVDLPAGKYLLQMSISATRCSRNWMVIREHKIDSLYLIGGDQKINFSITDGDNFKTFCGYFTFTEDGEKNFGFGFPDYSSSQASAIYAQNVQLYALTTDTSSVVNYRKKLQLTTGRATLKTSIDSATVLYNDASYKLQKYELKAEIDVAQSTYNDLTEVSTENIDSVNTITSALNNQITRYYTANSNVKKLESDLADAEYFYNDDTRTTDKATLKSAIDNVQTFYDGIFYPEVMPCSAEDSVKLTEQDSLVLVNDTIILKATEAFCVTNASETTPAALIIKNPVMKVASKAISGWTIDGNTGNSVWKSSYNAGFDDYYCASYWRGSTAEDLKYAYQDFVAPYDGYYEFSLQVWANVDDAEFVTTDSTAEGKNGWSGAWMFFADPEKEWPSSAAKGNDDTYAESDALVRSTWLDTLHVYSNDRSTRFYITRSEAVKAGETIRYGINTLHRSSYSVVSANHLQISSARLYYLGVTAPTDAIRVLENNEPTTSKAMGIYSLSGQRLNSAVKQKGIYIIDGKKVVIK